MNLRYLLLITSCLAFGSTAASAKNFYVGLNAGIADQSGSFSIIDSRLNPGVGITGPKDYLFPDDSASTFSLLAGYKLGADMALEVGVANNAEIEGSSRALSATETALEKVESNYLYTAFVGVWPMQHGWTISGRLGFSIWDIDFTQTVTDTAVPTDVLRVERLSDTTTVMFFGVGASYGLTSDIELKISIEQHNVGYEFTNVELDDDVLLTTLGVAYHF